MRRIRSLLLIATVAVVGCGLRGRLVSSGDGPEPGLPKPVPMGTQLTLWESDWLFPHRVEGDGALFDLSALDSVRTGRYSDFTVWYMGATSCPEDVALLNYRTRQWDQVSSSWPFAICLHAFTAHSFRVEPLGFDVTDYVSEACQMKVSHAASKVRVHFLNPAVDSASIRLKIEGSMLCFTYSGSALWIATAESPALAAMSGDASLIAPKLLKVTPGGQILRETDAPGTLPLGMAYGGGRLWVAGGDTTVYALDDEGNVISSFAAPGSFVGRMTWADGRIWAARPYDSETHFRLYAFDPDRSLASGVAVVVDSLDAPERSAVALAYDGEHLLVAGLLRLSVVSMAGETVATYPLPNHYRCDIAWDGEAILMPRTDRSLVRYSLP